MALSPHKHARRGTLSRVKELGKTPGGVEAKIHDPEESNYVQMLGESRLQELLGSITCGEQQQRVMSKRGNASGTMPLQLLTRNPGDAHCATCSSESAGRTSTGEEGSTGPWVLGSSSCINPVYENIPEKRAEQLPMKATCLQRKFKSSSKGLVVVPFYITQSFWYKQLPGD